MDIVLTVCKIYISLSFKLSVVNVPNLGPRVDLPQFGNLAAEIFLNI